MRFFNFQSKYLILSITFTLFLAHTSHSFGSDIPLVQESVDSLFVFEPTTIVGTASRNLLSSPLAESPGLELSTSRVDSEDIKLQGAKTIVDAIDFIPGAMVESRGRKVKQFFSIRGQRYPYPDYALNGAVFREFHEFPYLISASGIDNIEVLRSGAAMLSGVSGLSGLINIIPRRYGSKETEIITEYGSYNTRRMGVSHGNRVGDFNYSLNLEIPGTDGPPGKYARERISNLSGNIQWIPSPSFTMESSIFLVDGNRKLAQAESPALVRLQEAREYYDPLRAIFGTFRVLHRQGYNSSNELIIFFAKREQIFTSLTDTSSTTNDELDHEFGFNLARTMSIGLNNTLRTSFYYNRWVAPNGKRFYYGKPCELETFSTSVVNEHRLGRLVFDTGARYEQTYIHEYGAFNIWESTRGLNTVVPVTNQWETPVLSGSLGAAFYMSPVVSFHLNLNAGHILPRRGTLDTDMQEPGSEFRLKTDAGVNFQNRTGKFSLTGFFVNQSDAIILSGKTEMVNGRITELYDNRDQLQHGLEIEARSVHLRSFASFFWNGMVLRSKTEVEGEMKQDRELPKLILSGGGMFNYMNADMNIYWKYISGYQSKRFSGDGLQKPLGDFHTLNLTCGISFGRSKNNRLYAEIYNITDERYSTVVGYPDFGRRFNLGVRQIY